VVEAKLALRWSPQQIAGWLPLAYPQDPVMRVSHETIYLSLFIQSRGALRREFVRNRVGMHNGDLDQIRTEFDGQVRALFPCTTRMSEASSDWRAPPKACSSESRS
jgi:IS30 family transposase